MLERTRRPLIGKSVVITGAAGGIGRALARRFGAAGASTALLDRNFEGARAAADAMRAEGMEALALECDVTDIVQCRTAIDAARATHGGIDILVNNAGMTHLGRLADTDVEVVRRVMEVNFFGAVHCTKVALESLLERRGLIIVISSVAGFAPLAGRCGYSASKHALHGMFESLRADYAARGLRVMMVCPGFTATDIERHALGGDGKPARTKRTTVGTDARPEDVADSIVRGALRGRRLLVLSPVGRLSYLLTRAAPGLYERAMTRRMGGG